MSTGAAAEGRSTTLGEMIDARALYVRLDRKVDR